MRNSSSVPCKRFWKCMEWKINADLKVNGEFYRKKWCCTLSWTVSPTTFSEWNKWNQHKYTRKWKYQSLKFISFVTCLKYTKSLIILTSVKLSAWNVRIWLSIRQTGNFTASGQIRHANLPFGCGGPLNVVSTTGKSMIRRLEPRTVKKKINSNLLIRPMNLLHSIMWQTYQIQAWNVPRVVVIRLVLWRLHSVSMALESLQREMQRLWWAWHYRWQHLNRRLSCSTPCWHLHRLCPLRLAF